MSEANRVGLRFIEENGWNSTPTTPTMQALRFTSDSLKHQIDTTQSQEIRSDRNIADTVQTLKRNVGGFEFELSFETFDKLLEGALFSSWSTLSTGGTISNGVLKRFYSIEKAMLDEAEYFMFSGLIVNTFGLTIAASSIVTGNIDFLGSDAVLAQTTGATAVTDPTTNPVINAMSNVGTIQEGGTLTALDGVFLQEIGFSINNNLRTIAQIGSDSLGAVPAGSCEITGTLNAYFNTDRLWDKFQSGAETGLTFTCTDSGGEAYTFLFPRIKFEDSEVAAGGINTDVWENIQWRALYDETEGCQMRVTRTIT